MKMCRPLPSSSNRLLGRHGSRVRIMFLKDAEGIVQRKCALLVGKYRSSLNKLQSDEEEKSLLMLSASPLIMSLSSLDFFSALGQTGLTLASPSAVSAFSTTAPAIGISGDPPVG